MGLILGEQLSMKRWKNPIISILIGMILLKSLQWIPIIKWLVCASVAAIGVGASILSGFGIKRA